MRSVGRPSTAVLTRERIVRAALTLIDEVGADAFSVNALATRLEVSPSSLYNHVSGKDDLLVGVQEVITDAIDSAMFTTQPWADAVAAWARSYRAAFVRHPHAIPLFATSPVAGAIRTMEMYERVVRGFEHAGWAPEHIISAVVALESFILGSALDAAAPTGLLSPGGASDHVPQLSAAVDAHEQAAAGTSTTGADMAFETGLAAMITGLAAHHHQGEAT